MTSLRVIFANRCPGTFWSIEELFRSIAAAMPASVSTDWSCAPTGRANLKSLLANLLWFRGLKGADVIHQTGDIHYAILADWGTPVVLTIHDLRFFDEARGLKRWLFWLLWLYLPCMRANRITVISEFTRERLLACCPLSRDKVSVVPNCVAVGFQQSPKPWPVSKARILAVGTTANKNLERLIEACAGFDVEVVVLGVPSPAQREHIARHGVAHTFRSKLSGAEVADLYAECDLVAFVSTYEGFGMPILEAQAVGRPVLTSDLSPMREVAGDGALLVDPLDVPSIRNGLKSILDDEALRKALVAQGFGNVKKYSAEEIAGKYAKLYRDLLDER